LKTRYLVAYVSVFNSVSSRQWNSADLVIILKTRGKKKHKM